MFSKELIPILLHVLSSWQVIAVTIAFLLFVSLISFVARTQGRLISSLPIKIKKIKTVKTEVPVASVESDSDDDEIDDELGLV
jgi:hypothetical protein